jgi:hypothetical protein
MQVYTCSESRQKLAVVLNQAEGTGKVLIRRKHGRTFALIPERIATSPLDVPSIKTKMTTKEVVDIIREGREKWNNLLHGSAKIVPFEQYVGKFIQIMKGYK